MLNFVLMRSAFCRGVACASLSERENELLQYSLLLSVSAKKDRSVTVRFRSRGLSVVGLRKQPLFFCEFNFGSKDQRYKIEGLDPNKESNKL